jgi:hypothetical protein
VFPVRYELDLYVFLRRNSVFKGLREMKQQEHVENYIIKCSIICSAHEILGR